MRSAVKLVLGVSALGVGAALAAQIQALNVLSTLQRGEWTVTMRDGSAARKLCLGDPAQFLQMSHAGSRNCRRVVVEGAPGGVTVQYTCRGNGFGRTTLRRETDTLVQIESEGVAGGRPFDFSAEARRTGACR